MIARRRFLAASTLLPVAGCGGPPPPAVVDLTIKASPNINPTAAGTPVAVAVRLYSLLNRGRFSSADAYAIMDRESATLGTESAGSEEVVVRPGETKKITLSPKPGVQYIGAAVLFREIDRSQWRSVASIAPTGATKLTLTIDGTRADLVSA
ncbi:MAG: type VI secretion system lipoprotein TssJ [Reyranellaceae bacterium]